MEAREKEFLIIDVYGTLIRETSKYGFAYNKKIIDSARTAAKEPSKEIILIADIPIFYDFPEIFPIKYNIRGAKLSIFNSQAIPENLTDLKKGKLKNLNNKLAKEMLKINGEKNIPCVTKYDWVTGDLGEVYDSYLKHLYGQQITLDKVTRKFYLLYQIAMVFFELMSILVKVLIEQPETPNKPEEIKNRAKNLNALFPNFVDRDHAKNDHINEKKFPQMLDKLKKLEEKKECQLSHISDICKIIEESASTIELREKFNAFLHEKSFTHIINLINELKSLGTIDSNISDEILTWHYLLKSCKERKATSIEIYDNKRQPSGDPVRLENFQQTNIDLGLLPLTKMSPTNKKTAESKLSDDELLKAAINKETESAGKRR